MKLNQENVSQATNFRNTETCFAEITVPGCHANWLPVTLEAALYLWTSLLLSPSQLRYHSTTYHKITRLPPSQISDWNLKTTRGLCLKLPALHYLPRDTIHAKNSSYTTTLKNGCWRACQDSVLERPWVDEGRICLGLQQQKKIKYQHSPQ